MNRINRTGQLPITQEHFDLLTGVDSRGVSHQTLRDRVTTDTVATPQDSQWTQRVQGTPQAMQFFSVQRQTCTHGSF